MNFLDLPDLFRDRVVAFCDAQTIVNLRSRSETVRISLRGPKNKFEPDLKVDHATIFTTTFQKMLSGQEFLKKNSVEIGRKRLTTLSWRHHYVIVTSWWEKKPWKVIICDEFRYINFFIFKKCWNVFEFYQYYIWALSSILLRYHSYRLHSHLRKDLSNFIRACQEQKNKQMRSMSNLLFGRWWWNTKSSSLSR